MAARLEAPFPEVVELPSLTAAEFDPLLEEEIAVWRDRFAWDFRASANLLRRFMQIRSLYGYALRDGNELIGYAYHVCEGHKGLIGDFYVRDSQAGHATEMMLLGATVQGLMLVPGVRRIESQLLLLHPPTTPALPFSRFVKRHDRYFMETSCESALKLAARTTKVRVSILPWAERYREEVAHLVAASYRGHVDSDINDQYRTIPGARHFLMNIIQFPGCGQFAPKASVVAVHEGTGRICGVCLASMVSENAGHITQLCILPALRGARLGYELLRQGLLRLTELGCTSVSLTVTCVNVEAIRLYEAAGFRVQSTFPALVWEGF